MKKTIIIIIIIIIITRGLGGWRKSGDHPNYRTIENDQNTEKNLVDFRRLAVTQNSNESPSVNAVVKNSPGVNNNNINNTHSIFFFVF